jgi:phosphoenolpyruvate-protein kinase (PTS system EI component)
MPTFFPILLCCAPHVLQVILVRKETSPEDVKGMYTSEGVLCQLGGMTSHAAVVARGWGKPCITGVQDMQVWEGHSHPQCHVRQHQRCNIEQ